jgi:IS30 family transposase
MVEREWLAERLEAGASIEAIAREVGRDPSTVSYWIRKHGLKSAHAERHAARGPIERELLAEIVACDLPVRDMADVLGRSPTTVRHWAGPLRPDVRPHQAARNCRCRRPRERP